MSETFQPTGAHGSKFSEPYRATKLWLEAVAIFRRGVPLGKHRNLWKSYENSFIAQEAITWFQSQLQVAFDPAITRKQTWKLLQKFYKANIIIEVTKGTAPTSNSLIDETDFKDNGSLYRLVCPSTPGSVKSKVERSRVQRVETPKKALPKSASQYNVVIKPLTEDQIQCIWEQVFIDKFVNVVGCDVFTSFFKPGIIRGSVLAYNLTKFGPHNITLPVAKEEDLPHWLVSAMKCLSNWPNNHTQESGVPSYPGFENDVYKLIADYFLQFQNKQPLLSYDLYDAFITCFIRAELFDFNSRLYSAKISNASRTRVFQQPQSSVMPKTVSFAAQSPMFKMEDQYPFNASESVEDLILDILTPSTQRHRKWKPDARQISRKNLFNSQRSVEAQKENNAHLRELNQSSMSTGNESNLGTAMPNPMSPNAYNINRYTLPLYYETAFTGNETPITRVVSRTELKASLGNKSTSALKIRPPAASADAILDGNNYCAYENPTLELSGADLINHPKYSKIKSTALGQISSPNLASSTFWNYSTASASGYETGTTTTGYETGSSGTGSPTDPNERAYNSLMDEKGRKPLRAYSAVNLTDAVKVGDRQQIYCNTLPGPGHRSTPWVAGSSLASHYANSPSKSVRRMLEFYYGADACVPGLMTSEGKQLAIMSFRLLALLLPPGNRRHLQILLRFMSKASRNDKLMLDVAASTRAIIINTFFRAILKSEDPDEYDELLALRIVTFLMDNDHEIFAVAEDSDIAVNSQDKISEQQIIKVPLEPALTRSSSSPTLRGEASTQPRIGSPVETLDGSPLSENYVFAEANKENSAQFCSRISMNEYDDQRLLSGTSKSLRDLLEYWVNDDKLDSKEKRKQILKFKSEYPHIFHEKFGDEVPSFLDETKSQPKKDKKSWNVFKALRI